MGKNSKIGTIVQCLGKDDGYDLNGKPANSILFGTIKEVDNNGNYILSHIYNALNGSMDPLATLLLKPDNVMSLSLHEPLYRKYIAALRLYKHIAIKGSR